ncbi:MAG: acyltransferase family protein [Polaromonas sp.]|nr:acyltransferase family protein [Polaromonas sp.]
MSALKYRSDIDGLRALAVLPVVIYHVDPSLLPGGFLGVDIFFVISGYLISLILYRQQADGSFGFKDFYARRIRRLFPALILVLTATLGVGFFALFANEYDRLARHAVWAMAFLLNFRLIGEAGYFDLVSYSKPLLHLWSLSVEEQFYVYWPLLLLLFRRLRLNLVWVLALCALFSLAYALWLGDINPDRSYYHPLARFWELLAGAAIAYMHHKNGVNWLPGGLARPWMRGALSVAGLLLTVSGVMVVTKTMQHPGLATLWPLVGVVALIAAGPTAPANRLLAFQPLVFIGLISYPLYLWHWPILSYVRIAESGNPVPWVLWCGASLAVALAWLTYRWIELPLRRATAKGRVTISLVIGMGVLLGLSIAIAASSGFPARSSLQYLKVNEAQMIRPPHQDDSCLNLFKGGTAPVYCRQHNAGARMVGIIGDSHAHAVFAGVSELAEKQGYGTLLLANSGCPLLVGAVTGRNQVERQQCAHSIENIINALTNDKRISSVIIASRGPQYLTGLGFGPVEAGHNHPPITTLPSPGRPGLADPSRIFADGLVNTATHLHQHGMGVAYLLQVPELGVPAKDCLGRPLTLLAHPNQCTVSYEVYQRRMLPYRMQMYGLAAKAPFLKIIDTERVFCTTVACSGFIDNQLLYADDNHLSEAGSRKIAPIILKAALGEGHGK